MTREEIINALEDLVNSAQPLSISEMKKDEIQNFLSQLKEEDKKELWVADNNEPKWVELFSPNVKPILKENGMYAAEMRSFRVPREWFPGVTRETPKKIKFNYL